MVRSGSRSLGGRALHDAGPETETDRGPRVDVDVSKPCFIDLFRITKELTETTQFIYEARS